MKKKIPKRLRRKERKLNEEGEGGRWGDEEGEGGCRRGGAKLAL